VSTVAIREYGLLGRVGAKLDQPNCIDLAYIPDTAWDWLLRETCGDFENVRLVRPVKKEGLLYLQVLNYVGVVRTPCGCTIEVLPKTTTGVNERDLSKERSLLLKMLNRVFSLNLKELELTDLQLAKRPLPEILVNLFLVQVKDLVKRGVRSDYISVKAEAPYLRGRLRIESQLRQRAGRDHFFSIEYDDFIPDRPENRLIHSSLKKSLAWIASVSNRKLARELIFAFEDIPVSRNYSGDFLKWQSDRNMILYRGLKPWCQLILGQQTPFSISGSHFGQSFLFPMNELFEKYVAAVLRRQIQQGLQLKEQASSRHLVQNHNDQKLFQLRPDILILDGGSPKTLLDCKWKILDQTGNSDTSIYKKKYGIQQSDLYQLYAYGKKYLNGSGCMYIVHPRHQAFKEPLDDFQFDENLRLRVIPFDLDADQLVVDRDGFESWLDA